MKKFLFFLFLVVSVGAFAQPFKKDIEAFKKQDNIAFPPKNEILFVGSS